MLSICSKEEFEDCVKTTRLNKKRYVVVKFGAEWCGPCQNIAPAFARLAKQYKKYAQFVNVDIEEAMDNDWTEVGAVKRIPHFQFIAVTTHDKTDHCSTSDEHELENKLKSLLHILE